MGCAPTPGSHLTAPLICACNMDPMGPERQNALATLAVDYPSDDESEGLPEPLEAEDSGNESAAPSYVALDQDEARLASPDPDETGAAVVASAHHDEIQRMIEEGIISPSTPPPPGDEDWHPIPRWGQGWSERICVSGSPFLAIPPPPRSPQGSESAPQRQSKWKLSKLQDTTAPQALCCLVFRSLSGSQRRPQTLS